MPLVVEFLYTEDLQDWQKIPGCVPETLVYAPNRTATFRNVIKNQECGLLSAYLASKEDAM